MPSRILREGILTSERVDLLSCEAEVFYRRAMSVVDDFGRFSANPKLLRASCYPLRIDDVQADSIIAMLDECARAGLVLVYTVDGKRYLEMLDFKQQVRAKESKCPAPEVQMRSKCVADAEQVKTDVHLGEGEGGDEVESEGVSDAGAVTAVELSIAFRKGGVQTQPADPRLVAFAEQGVTPEVVEAACAEAKRVKPNEVVGLGYVAKIVERWAADAKRLKVEGAAAPQKHGSWWASSETMLAKAAELGLKSVPGESSQALQARIRAVIDNGGKPPAPKQSPPAIALAAEPKRVEIPPELRAQRSGELKAALKSKTA